MSWFLILVAAVIVIFTVMGYKKGLIKIILSLASIFVAMILVSILMPVVSGFVREHTTAYEKVYQSVDDRINIEIPAGEMAQENIIDGLELPDAVKEFLIKNNNIEEYAKLGVTSFENYIVQSVADVIFKAIVYSCTFAVAFIAVKVIFGVFNILSRLPVINEVNKLAGLLVGLAEGVLVVWIIMTVVTMLGNTELGLGIFEQINDSKVLSFIYQNNLIIKYLFKI